MTTLSIIGCGRVGKTLGRLWNRSGTFRIHQVMARSPESATKAAEFIGTGIPVTMVADLEPADVFFLAASDDAITSLAKGMAERQGLIQPGNLVFHAAGVLPTAVLAPLAAKGALIANLHPLRSFANPNMAAMSFQGTPCVIDGDVEATALLTDAVKAIGGVPVSLKFSAEDKALYHAGTVLAAGGVVCVLEVATRCLIQAGMPPGQVVQLVTTLASGVVNNVAHLGASNALTGPVARGEVGTISRHLAALENTPPLWGEVYSVLGKVALELSQFQGKAELESLGDVKSLLAD